MTNLTDSETTKLRAICKVVKLDFPSLYTRPIQARKLINQYKWTQPTKRTEKVT